MYTLSSVILKSIFKVLISSSAISLVLWYFTDKTFLLYFTIVFPILLSISLIVRIHAWYLIHTEVTKLQRFINCSDQVAFEAIYTYKIFDEIPLQKLEIWDDHRFKSWLDRKRADAAYKKGDLNELKKHLPG